MSPTSRRWIDIASMGGAAAILVVATSDSTVDTGAYAKKLVGGPQWGAVIAVSVIFALVFRLRYEGRNGGVPLDFGCRHPLRYPPAWFGVSIALVLTTAAAVLGHEGASRVLGVRLIRSEIDWFAIGAYAIIAMLLPAMAAFFERIERLVIDRLLRRRIGEGRAKHEGPMDGDMEFARWIDSDAEIDHPDSDAFGAGRIADRIASLATAPRTHDTSDPSVLLLGDFGSGKSSILRLAEQRIKSNAEITDIEVVRFGLWPYTSAEAAVELLLDAIVAAVARHVSVVGIRRIPKLYARTIKAGGGYLGMLGEGLLCAPSPQEIVSQLEQVLAAVRIRIVVMIEDTGRLGRRQQSRMATFDALVYLLQSSRRITIVAAVERIADSNAHKLARAIELVPRLESRYVAAVLERAIVACIHEAEGMVLLGRSTSSGSNNLVPLDQPELRDLLFTSSIYGSNSRAAIARLLNNPRRLKFAVRHVRLAWRYLAGEVDLEHLLIVAALRASAIEVFDHLLRSAQLASYADHHQASLVLGTDNRDAGGGAGERLSARDALHKNVKKIGKSCGWNNEKVSDVLTLIIELNPASFGSPAIVDAHPQGVQLERYLARALSPGPIDPEDRDQPILRVLTDCEEHDAARLLELVMSQAGQRLVHFGNLLPEATYVRMVRLCLAKTRCLSTIGLEREVPMPLALLSMLAERVRPISEARSRALLRWTRWLVTRNLPLAHVLIRSFISYRRGSEHRVDADRAREIGRLFRASVAQVYVGDASRLECALRDGAPWTTFQIISSIEDSGDADLAADQRRQVIMGTIKLARTNPAVGVPQLLPLLFVSHIDDRTMRSVQKLNRAVQQEFANDGELRDLIQMTVVSEAWDAEVVAKLAAAKSWARDVQS